jgi:hypothetical protein
MMLSNWQNRLKFNQIKPGDAVFDVFRISKTDTCNLLGRDSKRHQPAIETAKEAASYRHACRLKLDWVDLR